MSWDRGRYELRLGTQTPSAKIMAAIRAVTGEPFSTVKDHIVNGEPVLTADPTEAEEVTTLIALTETLDGLDIRGSITRNGDPVELRLVRNQLRSLRITEKMMGEIPFH